MLLTPDKRKQNQVLFLVKLVQARAHLSRETILQTIYTYMCMYKWTKYVHTYMRTPTSIIAVDAVCTRLSDTLL